MSQLWGGVECTINRVGNRYFNQLRRSGHWTEAIRDLARFAALGIRQLRFPVLWETIAPSSPEEENWSWTDVTLRELAQLGIKPIAGLLHHGSGPYHTSLVDPDFPEKFAAFARRVAERYPWIEAYTPVNEPLTTARFSCLYGHWYPHHQDDQSFVQAMLNQCRATQLAMREIRKVNPAAILVQTDDLGRTLSTPRLAPQAAFDNNRRWLGWDLLFGLVRPGHAMWNYLMESAADLQTLEKLADNPCPPNVVGVNHYVTSDRYLDESLEDYPIETHGGNRWECYADDAAVRASWDVPGFDAAISDAWRRYRTPIALTEVHLGCTEDEQLRWFMEGWNAAEEAEAMGIEIVGVTAWALLGSFDWNNLVTCDHGYFEAGVFDVREGGRRPTLLASALPKLSRGEKFEHPVLESPGWWRRQSRLRPVALRRSEKPVSQL